MKNQKHIMEILENVDEKFIEESTPGKRVVERKIQTSWMKYGIRAACVGFVIAGGVLVANVLQNQTMSSGKLSSENVSTEDNLMENNSIEATDIIDSSAEIPGVDDSHSETEVPEQSELGDSERIVPISTLLLEENVKNIIVEEADIIETIPIGQYTGIYRPEVAVSEEILAESKGAKVPGIENWYYVSGHIDMQYLIHQDEERHSLWRFCYFDSDEYLYKEALELVYQVDSADKIVEIKVTPANMDNTDAGQSLQQEIGTFTITDRKEIEELYQILSSEDMICYGDDQWDRIDYGGSDSSLVEAVRLARYLTVVTENYKCRNEIDGLKYTAYSDMFYEYSGVAYEPLDEKNAECISKILRIEG